MIADHTVVSHLHHAKQVVPFKRFMSSKADCLEQFESNFFGGIAFGTNVFYDVILTLTLRSALFMFYSKEN